MHEPVAAATGPKWLSKKRSDCRTLVCYNTYAAILFLEHYYGQAAKMLAAGGLLPDRSGFICRVAPLTLILTDYRLIWQIFNKNRAVELFLASGSPG